MLRAFRGIMPTVATSAFVDETAAVIGDVEIGSESSVWFNTVIRGDVHYIRIGHRTNIQDLSLLHVTHDTYPLTLGDDVHHRSSRCAARMPPLTIVCWLGWVR